MKVWIYGDSDRDEKRVREDSSAKTCRYCRNKLGTLKDRVEHPNYDRHILITHSVTVRCCPVCGWWTLLERRDKWMPIMRKSSSGTLASCGVLRNLDLRDQTIPLGEVRDYLAAKYDARYDILPERFEDVVVSVYRDLGYHVQATGKTGDGGIDAVLTASDGAVIGVQVKRYGAKIEAAQIREFVGALHIKGMLQGIYVTTSSYSKGARATAEQVFRRTPVQLVDAVRFYDQLGLAQRAVYKWRDDPDAPWNHAAAVYLGGYGTV
jgi:restriction system protein